MTQAAPVRPYVRRDGEGEALWFLGNLVTVKATGAETRGRVSVVEFVNPPDFAPPLHRHLEEDEMFYVLPAPPSSSATGSRFQPGLVTSSCCRWSAAHLPRRD